MICNRCNTSNPPGARTCAKCGAPLAAASDTQVFSRTQLHDEQAQPVNPAMQPATQQPPRYAATTTRPTPVQTDVDTGYAPQQGTYSAARNVQSPYARPQSAQNARPYAPQNQQAYAQQNPQTYAQQNPQTYAQQNPQAYAQQNPQAYAQQNPQAYAQQNPQAYAQQNPQAYAQQNPQAYAQQNPQAYAQQNPQTYAQQNPQAYAQQNPQAYAQQNPQTYAQQNPQTYAQQNPQAYAQQNTQAYAPQNPQMPQQRAVPYPSGSQTAHPVHTGIPIPVAEQAARISDPDAAPEVAPIRRASNAGIDEAYARRRPTAPAYNPDAEIEDDEPDLRAQVKDAHPHKNKLLIGGICALSVLALLMLVICFMTFTSAGQRWKASIGLNAPASAYWELGDEALAGGSVSDAANYYEQALSRDSSNYDGALKLANALKSAGDTERAERAYYKAISINPSATEPYDSVLELMTTRGATEAELVEMYQLAYQNTGDFSYQTLLAAYGPSAVRFDPRDGEYTYSLKLQMASDDGAEIYYTTDNSQPSTDSTKYVLPIELSKEGTYTVRAIAYKNGMASSESQGVFTITFPAVDAPQFTSKPGKYAVDSDGYKVISVNVPDGCTVYYTTDGSKATTDSKKYKDGISLKQGTYTLNMIAVNASGEVSPETTGDYEIIAALKAPFSDDDSFKSFVIGVTDQAAVNKQFTKLVSTSGDTNMFFTQHYSFGEVDFTVQNGTPIVTAVRITNNDITGVRGTKVGWDATDVIALFRDEKNAKANGERTLYTLDNDQYGWVTYDSNGDISSINYMYTRDGSKLVELHYTVQNGSVSAMEYCISDM